MSLFRQSEINAEDIVEGFQHFDPVADHFENQSEARSHERLGLVAEPHEADLEEAA